MKSRMDTVLVITFTLMSICLCEEVMSYTGSNVGGANSGFAPLTGGGGGGSMWGKINSRFIPMARRMDCQSFCRRTGFSGYVGGCQCGFTLFTKKSDSGMKYLGMSEDASDESDQQQMQLLYVLNHLLRPIPVTQSTPHAQSQVGRTSGNKQESHGKDLTPVPVVGDGPLDQLLE